MRKMIAQGIILRLMVMAMAKLLVPIMQILVGLTKMHSLILRHSMATKQPMRGCVIQILILGGPRRPQLVVHQSIAEINGRTPLFPLQTPENFISDGCLILLRQ